ncbi:MAG: hypothetical protein ACD_41C00261G0001 [uncultured bacterium]|nr:MAG: hypothetical protein ACD_41C00261G0001 [uncultured bacterium]
MDWSDPDAVATVNWRYQGNNDSYSISEIGTKTAHFEVDATTALLSGAVSVPDGTEALNGSINLTNNEVNYWGSVHDGAYILNTNPGTYTITFSPDTYANSSWGRYSYSGTVTILEGNNEFDFTVEELTATIHFTVTNLAGEPLADVQANAWSQNHWSGTQTDATGTATVYVQTGTWYDVGVWDEVYLSADSNQRVQVADGETKEVAFTMQEPNATVIATIVDADGSVPESLRGWFGCNTKDYSRHFGEDLRNGTVELGIIVEDGEFDGECSAWFQDETVGAVSPQEVTVAEGETVALEFTLQPLDATVQAVIKNFSTGKKIPADPSININLWNESDHMGHFAQLEDNPVEIRVVSNKSYTGGIWSNDQRYIPLWSMNSDVVKVAAGETGTLVLNVLEQDGTLLINANDPNGDPVEYGWAWCGNWEEVDFALDTAETNVVINTGAQIQNGVAEVPLVAGHTYRCGVGAGQEFVEEGWLSPPEQGIEYASTSAELSPLTFQFKEADAHLTGSISLGASVTNISAASQFDSVWCWAWSEGGSSWTEADPGEDYRLNVSTEHDQWAAGCDGVQGEDWYFTEQPYEFTPDKGKNTHDFTLEKMAAWKIYEAVSETFDATENKVITTGDGTTLTIPAGTLATEGNVTVRATQETNIIRTDDHPLMIPWDWEAFDSNDNLIETFLGGTVTISIPYTDEALAELGIEESSLVGRFFDELSGSWKQPDNISVDTVSNVVTVTTDHFTQYGVMYNARVSNTRKPTTPGLMVKSTGKHNVKVALRTKKTSPKATRFVVQVRKFGTASKKNWTETKLRNAKKKARLVRSIQKLKRSTNYEVRAKACNGAGCSQSTDWQSFKTE